MINLILIVLLVVVSFTIGFSVGKHKGAKDGIDYCLRGKVRKWGSMTREEQMLNGFTEMMRGFWNNQDLKVPDIETLKSKMTSEEHTTFGGYTWKVVVAGNCVSCGKHIDDDNIFLCKDCQGKQSSGKRFGRKWGINGQNIYFSTLFNWVFCNENHNTYFMYIW